jgi:WD40 repeat protein
MIAIGIEKGFYAVDLRTPSSSTLSQDWAHSDKIMDLDYNPNKLNTLVTCGQDSVVRFWDLRKPEKFLLEFEEDSHWINKVKFNRFHD